jgi:conjugal transfer pilus assembly protein TraF
MIKDNRMPTNLLALIVFFLCVLGVTCEAKPISYPSPKGWHWYNEPEKSKTNPQQASIALPIFPTASAALAFQKKVINEAKAQAVIDPTPEHIRLYRYVQEFVFQKVEQFTQNWQKVSLSDPNLDFSNMHPTASAAQPLLHQASRQKTQATIHALKRQFVLTYIYKSSEPLEANFEMTIKRFAQENQWLLKEINVEDATLLQQKGAQAMKRWLLNMHLPKTPAVLLVNPTTAETFPLAFGYIAQSELEKRCDIWLSEIQKERVKE